MSVIIKGMKIPEHFTRAEFGLDADGHNQVLVYYDDGPPEIYNVFELSDQHGCSIDADEIIELSCDAQSIRHGKWVEVYDGVVAGFCSVCQWESHLYEDDVIGMAFCPNCGADMRNNINQFEKMPQKVKVYGYSDDIVVIERSCYKQREIDCFNKDVIIHFEDGTVIRIGYSKPDIGVWYIVIEQNGTAPQTLTICEDDEAEIYSDIFEIESEVLSHEVVRKKVM